MPPEVEALPVVLRELSPGVRGARRAWFDEAAAVIGGLTPHELRHTAASLAVTAGASVLGVQRLLGHEKAFMTLDV